MSDLSIENHFGNIASLIGEKSRAIILWSLLDGRAYTATELAIAADLSLQSASNHLSQLLTAGLLRSEKQGRHKYYRFANDHVAQAIENIAGIMPASVLSQQSSPGIVTGIKYARSCYDHLAGRIGVQITRSLLKNRWLIDESDHYALSKSGHKKFIEIGVDIDAVQKQNRKFAYPCLDWSERTHHLGGALGAALLQSAADLGWIRRLKQSRELVITGKGRSEISRIFKLALLQ